jgi:histidyl-tRNA synthetase
VNLKAPRGTFDVMPQAARRRLQVLRIAEEVLGRAGYEPFETPVFEETELFARGVGESTDIVQKEMFTFQDKAGRSLTLRPEATAAMCRAYVEHGMHKLPQPVKLWTWGPFFRHEAPQAGRFRQFTQIDIEALGSDDPSIDAEQILLLGELIERAGAGPARLRISSLGTPETRAAYLEELKAYLRDHEADLSEEVRGRLDQNPLRAFDADHEGTQSVIADAPKLIERLSPEDRAHLDAVLALLDGAGMAYEIDATLVRGLDYYTRTVFEFESERLGAQAALGGGGRYDRLVEELGGPPTPAIGWAAGVERILLAAQDEEPQEPPTVFIAFASDDARAKGFQFARRLRDEHVRVAMEQAGRSMKGQMRQADRLNTRGTVIFGDGIEVRDMQSGEQRTVRDADEAVTWVKAFLK